MKVEPAKSGDTRTLNEPNRMLGQRKSPANCATSPGDPQRSVCRLSSAFRPATSSFTPRQVRSDIDQTYFGNDHFDPMSFVDRALKPGIANEYALIVTSEPGSGKLTSWSKQALTFDRAACPGLADRRAAYEGPKAFWQVPPQLTACDDRRELG